MLREQKDTIGRIIAYFSLILSGNLYLTRLLKLLYLLDEYSVKTSGLPKTWLTYQIWGKGPVPNEIYFDIVIHGGRDFKEYFSVIESGGYIINSNSKINQLGLKKHVKSGMDYIVDNYGKYYSSDLIKILHKENSLWHQAVTRKNLNRYFKSGKNRISPYTIDFEEIVNGNQEKLQRFKIAERALSKGVFITSKEDFDLYRAALDAREIYATDEELTAFTALDPEDYYDYD